MSVRKRRTKAWTGKSSRRAISVAVRGRLGSGPRERARYSRKRGEDAKRRIFAEMFPRVHLAQHGGAHVGTLSQIFSRKRSGVTVACPPAQDARVPGEGIEHEQVLLFAQKRGKPSAQSTACAHGGVWCLIIFFLRFLWGGALLHRRTKESRADNSHRVTTR